MSELILANYSRFMLLESKLSHQIGGVIKNKIYNRISISQTVSQDSLVDREPIFGGW